MPKEQDTNRDEVEGRELMDKKTKMVVTYKTSQEFLDASAGSHEQRELENNLILGICNGLSEKKS